MNHIRAVLDIPAEWRIYRAKYAEYIAKKLEGQDARPPAHHPGVWTFFALGVVIFYGGVLGGLIYALVQWHPLSTYIALFTIGIFWGVFGVVNVSDEKSYAEIEREEERDKAKRR